MSERRSVGGHDVTEYDRAGASRQRLSGRLLELLDEERRRIARELHDGTGQDLAALEMKLVELETSLGERLSESERTSLADCVALAQQCSRQTRNMSYLLHPPLLDALGLEVALEDLVEGFSERTGIPVRVEISPELGRLRRDVETALFRIVQECLVNVHRHSESPDAVVRLEARDDSIRLEVDDHGRGIARDGDAEGVGVGIRGMRERMHQLGGRFTVESDREGTRVRAVVPVATATGG